MKTQSAQVHFNDNGIPVADHFDDVYFSVDSGIEETKHVFMAGNDLPLRWFNHDQPYFVIAETGFGSGLNCLVAMAAFHQFREENPAHPLKHLYLLSTEKYPLSTMDLQQTLSAFPTLRPYVTALVQQYPLSLDGCHRLHFPAASTTLDLWLGDVHTILPQWHSSPTGLMDAWFLDGFAPSKNPDMWTDKLFTQMQRLSKHSATFATFTAAGVVKRGLKAVGFDIAKRKGFGRKRDMLTGCFTGNQRLQVPPPYARFNSTPATSSHRIGIVGGGLAAATLANVLARHGLASTLLCADNALATGASGNPQGGFYPQLHSEASFPSQIQALGFAYARRFYDTLSVPFDHQWCGVLQLGFSADVVSRQQKLLANGIWPDTLIQGVNNNEASTIAGVTLPFGGLFIPLGGWLSPPQLVNALLEEYKDVTTVQYNCRVTNIQDQQHGVTCDINGQQHQFDFLIVCTGADSTDVEVMQALPLRPVRGQVEAIPTQLPIDKLKTVLCHKGYMTPATEGRHALGSTYSKNDLACDIREQDTKTNLATHQKALQHGHWISTLNHDGKARASVRLALPDHQPAVGQLLSQTTLENHYQQLAEGKSLQRQPLPPANRLFTLTGLGSRGLVTAPILAEVLVAQLTHTPMPLPNHLLQAVSPSRFVIRELIRKSGAPD
ncbi:bifunctional tRNA (5-methylaminomethyl-2-thiouridine)(34)-methyltransferase MnmD/FAD-dependent 5-carboxymethylaminomethyl-2-thiouridine(34) oxidoreductase MnmC [Alteromonas sp. C1M14]|uniref:bifunctional tRNA (5-methylaminomethyl-2-thiouridine)(34)-methyltransferase MnmD/FAD-dependent 5-carboxymethylaminomethyl-2-thiouridine(34) oxidoreductase MnmC n=1 Tax=Alteromonas sp. C1M14 TaxID=2841567 RepID=UPI001C081361|nr:bifunctional tRNA (5-methylaminomethyl-2-thiouridine)(34)-methyltransferase MnmD/FAD-dependent 5-carboxymethylaminomethyl-2-thiouridine(34) oxidoreductase MnmC [Alteromonas sp. C1M14]MBU2979748.1 bifunctional tRNA (5-methylaminomethyl-2-thiouridine)(34)-methyltransferase MnmD/FAD-dependent 5-carboxymethylaminomethyl-2-thiouridine(34) oxidoreductase MnmC [Alteromonas sp. C1M14]